MCGGMGFIYKINNSIFGCWSSVVCQYAETIGITMGNEFANNKLEPDWYMCQTILSAYHTYISIFVVNVMYNNCILSWVFTLSMYWCNFGQ